jgi:hypothetical protein
VKHLEPFLESTGYKYNTIDQATTVNLSAFLEVKIVCKGNQISLSAKTTKWTGFSGFVSLNLEIILRLNTIGLFLLIVICELSKTPWFIAYDYTHILIIAITLNLMWYFHSLIIYQNFKSKIEMVHYFSQKNN